MYHYLLLQPIFIAIIAISDTVILFFFCVRGSYLFGIFCLVNTLNELSRKSHFILGLDKFFMQSVE